jgi:hypothetical protein
VEFGGHEAGVHRVHSLLGNLAIKFFCGNDDTVTNEWASKTIDKTVQYRVSLNGAQAGEGTQLVYFRVRNSIARAGILSGLGTEQRSMTTSSKRSPSRAAGDGQTAGVG